MMLLSQLLLVVAAVLAAFDGFKAKERWRLNRTALAIALVALSLAIIGTDFNKTLWD